MSCAGEAVDSLAEALDHHFEMYCATQEMHFRWLESVAFQLKMYSNDREDLDSPSSRELAPRTKSFPNQSPALPDLAGSKSNFLPSKSYSFNDQFPLVFDESSIPPEYEMSDDESIVIPLGDRDEEIYDTNPFEIHGKMVPLWARQESLRKQLKRQKKMDGDQIFAHLPVACPIEKVFGAIPRRKGECACETPGREPWDE